MARMYPRGCIKNNQVHTGANKHGHKMRHMPPVNKLPTVYKSRGHHVRRVSPPVPPQRLSIHQAVPAAAEEPIVQTMQAHAESPKLAPHWQASEPAPAAHVASASIKQHSKAAVLVGKVKHQAAKVGGRLHAALRGFQGGVGAVVHMLALGRCYGGSRLPVDFQDEDVVVVVASKSSSSAACKGDSARVGSSLLSKLRSLTSFRDAAAVVVDQ